MSSRHLWVCFVLVFRLSIGISGNTHAIVNRVSLARCVYRILHIGEENLVNFTEYSKLIDMLIDLHSNPEMETDLLFSMCDMDGDQQLSISEFKQLLVLFFGRVPARATVVQIWDKLCNTGASTICRSQYIRWLFENKDSAVSTINCVNRSRGYIVPSNMNPFQAYMAMKGVENDKDTRQPWYPRHHIN